MGLLHVAEKSRDCACIYFRMAAVCRAGGATFPTEALQRMLTVKKFLMSLAMLAAGALTSPAMAADCAITIGGNDQMLFDVKNVEVPKSCTKYTMTLVHTGKMPKSSMGHNIVISTTADANAVAADGMKAGATNEYVKPGDPRVIGFSKVIGGGESTTFDVDVSKLKPGVEYTYLCSFPGHSFLMRGVLKLGS